MLVSCSVGKSGKEHIFHRIYLSHAKITQNIRTRLSMELLVPFPLIHLKIFSLKRICNGLSHDSRSVFLFKICAYLFVRPNSISYCLNKYAYYLKEAVHCFVKQSVYICSLKDYLALAGVAQWIECQPANQRLLVQFLVKAHA